MLKKTDIIVSLFGICVSLNLSCSFYPWPLARLPVLFGSQNLKRTEIPKPETIPMPSPNRNDRPEGAFISTIVLHHTATAADAKQVGTFFANPAAGVSAHYTVDRTGYIVESVEDAGRAWHAGRSEFEGVPNVNNFSVGIEICNIGDGLEPYPDSQYDTVIRLVAYLVQVHSLPLTRLTRHRDVALPHGRKVDTSDNLAPEIQYLNPQIQDPERLPIGVALKIPTDYRWAFSRPK